MTATPRPQPQAWAILEQALLQRRSVSACYHGHQRLLFPHALGWHHGRAMVLAYQGDGTTSQGSLAPDPRQRWRSMFIDEVHEAVITDQPWQTAHNYSPATTGISQLHLVVDRASRPK